MRFYSDWKQEAALNDVVFYMMEPPVSYWTQNPDRAPPPLPRAKPYYRLQASQASPGELASWPRASRRPIVPGGRSFIPGRTRARDRRAGGGLGRPLGFSPCPAAGPGS
ncbi:unnamed protein product [Caretta caretta]